MEANEKKTGGTLKKNPSVLTSGILKVLKYLFLIVIIVISIGPIVWAFLSSFKTYAEINASALSLPKQFNLKNYIDAFRYAPIQKYFEQYYRCWNERGCNRVCGGNVRLYRGKI